MDSRGIRWIQCRVAWRQTVSKKWIRADTGTILRNDTLSKETVAARLSIEVVGIATITDRIGTTETPTSIVAAETR